MTSYAQQRRAGRAPGTIRPRPDVPGLDTELDGLNPTAGISSGMDDMTAGLAAALEAETAVETAFDEAEFTFAALPSAKPIPGYHLMWASTTSQYQPVQMYLSKPFCYSYVTEEDYGSLAPNERFWEGSARSASDPGGAIRRNEMVLLKVPMEHYQKIMTHFHHRLPLQSEEALDAQRMQIQADLRGRRVPVDDLGDSVVQGHQRVRVSFQG